MDVNERQSFVMYASYLDAAEKLEPVAFKECILKLRDYALTGDDVHSKDLAVEIILTMAKPNLNAASARYQRCVENGTKGKEYGSKGGRPRKGESREEYLERKRKPETPRKPLDVDDDDNKKNNKNDNAEVIQSPTAMEPARGSGSSIGFTSPITIESIFKPVPSKDDARVILDEHKGMSNRELEDRYEQVIDKIAKARANDDRHRHEALLATEAAMICYLHDGLPTFKEAKESVVRDINAAVQQVREDRIQLRVEEDENDKPF